MRSHVADSYIAIKVARVSRIGSPRSCRVYNVRFICGKVISENPLGVLYGLVGPTVESSARTILESAAQPVSRHTGFVVSSQSCDMFTICYPLFRFGLYMVRTICDVCVVFKRSLSAGVWKCKFL